MYIILQLSHLQIAVPLKNCIFDRCPPNLYGAMSVESIGLTEIAKCENQTFVHRNDGNRYRL
jgi:hypothetical protein